jgi:hypothetical protein
MDFELGDEVCPKKPDTVFTEEGEPVSPQQKGVIRRVNTGSARECDIEWCDKSHSIDVPLDDITHW